MPSDPDSFPTASFPNGPCPRCGRNSNFEVVYRSPDIARIDARHSEQFGLLKCSGCQESSLVVVVQESYATNSSTTYEKEVIHVYPAPGAGQLDPSVVDGVASAYDEGQRCLSIGASRAAAVMFRSALSFFVKDKGGEQARAERHLKSALRHMKNDGRLHSSLWEWADYLNQIGNEGAHPEDYDDVTIEEARELGRFVRHLIQHEYEMPAQLDRARQLGGAPTASNAGGTSPSALPRASSADH